ncbi:MAG: DNA replication/repair protein RecF [SAR202 cluster bacterium Io17-Chloro-G3]|nr:MAG: DNA replication/repair protein RecF [SAR202 cluster bacterium Io17-Chloro-G3]
MYLSRLALTDYRNFQSLELELPQGALFIVGDNAQGKSNLLEATYLLSIAKSYRTNTERELVRQGILNENMGPPPIPQTLISGDAETREGRLRIIVGLRAIAGETDRLLVKKLVRVNSVPTTGSGLMGRFNAVLFTADDIELVYGSPSVRRRFMDILISQVDRSYLRALQRYQHVVTQRNHLLRFIRDHRSSNQELDFWDAELVKEGTSISTRREEVVGHLTPLATRSYADLTNSQENFSLSYQPTVASSALAKAVEDHRDREIGAGMTLIGPHRDDLAIEVADMRAGIFASRGQARTIALALRLAEAVFLKDMRGEEPVLLLDDVLSEMDTERRHHVLREAGKYQQALVTTAEPALIQDSPIQPSAVLTIRRGIVTGL